MSHNDETSAGYGSEMTPQLPEPRHLVVVGAGMVAHRLIEALRSRDSGSGSGSEWRITVFGDEAHKPYDRVGLTSYFAGKAPKALALGGPQLWSDPYVSFVGGDAITSIDRDAKTVTSASGRIESYDNLVLATGSSAALPPIPGTNVAGVFVYRTVDDVVRLGEWVAERAAALGRPVRGAIVGGGLLGLEAAGALQALGAGATVVQSSGRLMSAQVDAGGGEALRRLIGRLGVEVRLNSRTAAVTSDALGNVGGLWFEDGGTLPADVVVFAVGIRPRDELARTSGLATGTRGGVAVDESCRTADPSIWAIGEVAAIDDVCHGLVAPGYSMAEVVVDRLLGGSATFPGVDLSTKLKLTGVDVASFGDAFGETPGALEVVYADPVAGVYKKLVLSDDARILLGGVLVGDASAYASLRPMVGRELGVDPANFLLPEGSVGGTDLELPADAVVCSCNNVTAGEIRCAVTESACTILSEVKACTNAGTSCGSCVPLVKKLVGTELKAAGVEVSTALCEHFDLSRSQLFEAIRIMGLATFTEIVARHGSGRGCDICKPVVASILSSLGGGHILDGEQATLQDTNDHVMANLQKDGSYSVVPRIPGGEITPDGLLVIGQVAKDFGLYTKITGGQRIDLFGARIDQLPAIWRRLVDAGFESGHAYGKSLRTVKSCVGSTWCRFGVQDAVSLAIELELRYRGLRSPHKFKMGVSGCARECAEARGKDVGVIATDNGWNMYVGGNGGFTPRHAVLFAEDLDTATLLTTIDRFLMYYIRTADRLQRTAPWVQEIEGGIDAIRSVVLDDSLGIGADLDAAMALHVLNYEDEWKATLDDPEKLRRFASFVNAPDTADDSFAYVSERGQPRPATQAEREEARRSGSRVQIAGTTLEVRR